MYLSFPDSHAIDWERLRDITVEIYGFCYVSKRPEADHGGAVHYCPQKGVSWYTNSFMPVIAVEEAPGSSGMCLCIAGELTRAVRLWTLFSFGLICLLQYIFIRAWLDGLWENPFAAFLPAVMFSLWLILSHLIMSFATKAFAEKYRAKLEEFMPPEEKVRFSTFS